MTADIGRFGGLRYRQPIMRVSRTFLVLRNPLKNFELATMLKLLKILSKHRVYLLLTHAMGRGNGLTLSVPSLTKTTNTYAFDKLNVSLLRVYVQGQHCKKAVFPCKNENSALSEHACKPTLQFGGVILKLLSLVYTYCIYSSKRRGAYLIFRASRAALI